jgi:signal transduction histidine kinase
MNILSMGIDLVETDLKENSITALTVTTVEEIKSTTKSVLRILNDLLLYEKLHSGEMELEKTPCCPVHFLVDVLRPFSLQARQAAVELTVLHPFKNNLDELDLVTVDIDVNKMGQAVSNFVSNAIKFAPNGFVEVNCNVLRGFGADNNVLVPDDLSDQRDESEAKRAEGISQSMAELKNKGKAKWLRISVTDTGGGLTPAQQSRLFREVSPPSYTSVSI